MAGFIYTVDSRLPLGLAFSLGVVNLIVVFVFFKSKPPAIQPSKLLATHKVHTQTHTHTELLSPWVLWGVWVYGRKCFVLFFFCFFFIVVSIISFALLKLKAQNEKV